MNATPVPKAARAFQVGRTLVTIGAAAKASRSATSITDLLNRHCMGDDGNVTDQQHRANLRARREGLAIKSEYREQAGTFYVITKGDRSATVVMIGE